MQGPDVPPNYPSAPEEINSFTLTFKIMKEYFYLHKDIDLTAHICELDLNVSVARIGVAIMGQEFVATPAVFQTPKGIIIETERFGSINFPRDFDRIGDL